MYPPDSNFYVLRNYAYMPNALHSQATMLQQAFQTMTPQDPSWNMDTDASSHLANNTDYQTQKLLLCCDSTGDLHLVTHPPSSSTPFALLSFSHSTWHRRLGHPANLLQPTAHFTNASPTPPPNTHLVIHIPHSPTSVTPSAHTQSLTNTSLPTQSDTTHPTTYAANPTQTVSMHPMVTRAKARIFKPLEHVTYHVTTTSPLPHSHVYALRDSNWKEPMLDEYNALISNGTWVFLPRPANVNVVCSMWLFKRKFHTDGSLSRYKDRLIANGRSQQQGIKYDETFSSVVKPATIHTVLSLAVSHDWPIHHLDVKNAFLHVHLSKTVYMHQPPEFVDSARPDYGSKRRAKAPLRREAWPPRYKIDQGVCSRHLGSLNYFLGISAQRIASGLFLSQSKFAEEILERTHMQHCNPCRNPVDTESKLGPDGDSVSDSTLFRGLLYVSTTTQLTEYTDADWAGCPVTHDPLLEAGYHGVANVVAETTWIRNLLLELHAPLHSVMLVYCDNFSVVYLSTNSVHHQYTKHIEIDIHFVRDYVASRQVHVLHVPSRFQYADIFTKGIPIALFLEFRSSLNVRTPHVLIAKEY
uniref:Reverse transcriptase Ty1/copia-type domain-containing protein n=1 Tax=Tanacetum cinerariifolium TaxID=118510 RepID=A0A699ILD8_TANCI|nr:hypothetical protein [Tanacetum cinerariifolium]